jgi:hypothetical protein
MSASQLSEAQVSASLVDAVSSGITSAEATIVKRYGVGLLHTEDRTVSFVKCGADRDFPL